MFAKARKGQEALEARISKEEKEYLESFAQERKAKDELGILEAELKEVETMVSPKFLQNPYRHSRRLQRLLAFDAANRRPICVTKVASMRKRKGS